MYIDTFTLVFTVAVVGGIFYVTRLDAKKQADREIKKLKAVIAYNMLKAKGVNNDIGLTYGSLRCAGLMERGTYNSSDLDLRVLGEMEREVDEYLRIER